MATSEHGFCRVVDAACDRTVMAMHKTATQNVRACVIKLCRKAKSCKIKACY